jgi:hypothetical protein
MANDLETFKPAGASLTRHVGSPSALPALTSPSVATERALLLLGSYRKGEADDPDTYVTAIAAVLTLYDPAIVARVTDPRTGIAGRVKWLPTVHEVRAACEEEAAFAHRMRQREAAIEKQLADRRAADAAERNRPARVTLEDLRAKHGPNWGLQQQPE